MNIFLKSRGRKCHETNIFSLSMHSASKWIIRDAGPIPEAGLHFIFQEHKAWTVEHGLYHAGHTEQTMNSDIWFWSCDHTKLLNISELWFYHPHIKKLRQDRLCFLQMCFSRSCQLHIFRMSRLLFVGQTTELTDSSLPCGLSVSNVLNSSVHNV